MLWWFLSDSPRTTRLRRQTKEMLWSTKPRKQGVSTRQSRCCFPTGMVCTPNTMLFVRFQVSSRNSASQAETDANLATRMQCPRNEQHDRRPLQRRYSRTCRESVREPCWGWGRESRRRSKSCRVKEQGSTREEVSTETARSSRYYAEGRGWEATVQDMCAEGKLKRSTERTWTRLKNWRAKNKRQSPNFKSMDQTTFQSACSVHSWRPKAYQTWRTSWRQ